MRIKKGQVLIFVLFFLAILSILLGSLAVMWGSEMKMRNWSKERMVAFYLANAAVERAKAEIVRNVNLSGDKPLSGNDNVPGNWYSELDIAGDSYIFQYKYNVAINGLQRTIIARGRVLNSGGNLLVEKKIQVTVGGIQDNGFGADNNPPNNTVISWQEQ